MSWAKFSDDAQENEHILALSVPARWFWAAAIMANRGYKGGRSAFVSRVRAEALARQQDVPAKVIKELEDSRRWEATDGGWNIHDYEEFLPTQKEALDDHEPNPVKQAAGSKGAAVRWHHINKVDGNGIAGDSTSDSKPIAPRAPVRVDPVPVPVPTPNPIAESSKAPPVTPPRRPDASENGYDDATYELALGMQEVLGRTLSGLELIECQGALNQYAYLSASELLDRAHGHLEHCDSQEPKLPKPRTVAGFANTWRLENDHRADQGMAKAQRVQLGRTGGLTHIGDLTKELQP